MVGKHLHLPVSGAHHGLHGDGHARLKPGTVAGGAEVAHLRGLVELAPHTVTHKVPDHREAEGLHVGLDRVADIGHPVSAPGQLNALPEALLGDFNEFFCLVAHLPAGIGGGAVPVEAADIGAHIHADDVPLLKLAGPRDAVNHHLVDGDTGGGGKARVVQEGGGAAVALDEPADGGVNLMGGDPGGHHRPGQGPGLGGKPPGPAHGLDLPRRFNGNHFDALQDFSASRITAVVASMVG